MLIIISKQLSQDVLLAQQIVRHVQVQVFVQTAKRDILLIVLIIAVLLAQQIVRHVQVQVFVQTAQRDILLIVLIIAISIVAILLLFQDLLFSV